MDSDGLATPIQYDLIWYRDAKNNIFWKFGYFMEFYHFHTKPQTVKSLANGSAFDEIPNFFRLSQLLPELIISNLAKCC
jgi:hypothetical protein